MNPKEIVSNNLQYYLDRKGKTQTQMAKDLGYPEMTVSNWMKAKTYPRVDKMQEMADYFGIRRSDIEEKEIKVFSLPTHDYIYIPEAISAGLPFNIEGITEYEKIKLPDALMGKWSGDKDIRIMRINGESMNKTMAHDSLIAVKPIKLENLKNDDIVVFSSNHDYSVKQFYDDKENKKVVFSPHSKDRSFTDTTFDYDNLEGLEIHGKVVLYTVEKD